jgi:hypothetical protein
VLTHTPQMGPCLPNVVTTSCVVLPMCMQGATCACKERRACSFRTRARVDAAALHCTAGPALPFTTTPGIPALARARVVYPRARVVYACTRACVRGRSAPKGSLSWVRWVRACRRNLGALRGGSPRWRAELGRGLRGGWMAERHPYKPGLNRPFICPVFVQ